MSGRAALRGLCILFFLMAFALQAWGVPPETLRGTVKDRSGAVIARAQVTLHVAGQTSIRTTQADGTFVFDKVDASAGQIVVSAQGFASSTIEWRSGQDQLSIMLAPALVQQSLDVTATRTAILPTGVDNVEAQPDSVAIPAAELRQWGAMPIDDKLRQVPGFSLLRRSGSMTANPTSQGVSLRGLSANGASRALILADGIPLNDPFGSWIFWGRIPEAALDQAQVVPGGISALYGNDALGGVVNLETRSAIQTAAFAEGSFGSSNTPFGSGWGAMRFGSWALAASGEGFSTNGYIAVPPSARGTVDTPVASNHHTADLRLERWFGDRGRMFLDGAYYGESRLNGTPLQVNQTALRQLAFGTDYNSQSAGLFTLRMYGGTESYHQTFSSVAPNRNSESLTNNQNVPIDWMGLIAQWSKQIASRMTILAGVDGSDVQGWSLETSYVAGKPTANLANGGRQQSLGAFVEAIFQINPRWSVTFSGREDLWSNFDASSSRTPIGGSLMKLYYPPRGQNAFDPRLTTSYRASEHVVLYASGYRSFRAPTLNELYRSFRVGNVQTLANAYLQAEHFTGAEGGARATFLGDRVSIHGSFFWGEVSDPIANVTISSTPALILRQRQNLGLVTAPGFEAGTDIRFTNTLSLSATYQFLDSTVASFPANPALVGNMIPLVPHNQFTFRGAWAAPKQFYVSVQGRTASNEFDDDQNLLPLGGYFVLSAMISHSLPAGFDAFVAGDNLTNEVYEIARTPVVNTGQPILVRVGLRWQSKK